MGDVVRGREFVMSQLTTPSNPDVPPPPTDPDTPLPTSGPESPPPTVDRGDEGLPSAGEGGEASQGADPDVGRGGCEVIIGEIPDIEDLSVMRWTARCTWTDHGLLGHYDTREQAEQARAEHLATAHATG
jgi:hypothetical protein